MTTGLDDRGEGARHLSIESPHDEAVGGEQVAPTGEDAAAATRPCPRCSREIEPTYRWCPICGRATGWAPRPPQPADRPAIQYRPAAGYEAPGRLTRAVQLLLALWVVLAALAAAASLAEWRLLSRFLDDPLSVTVAQVEASNDRQSFLGVIWIIAIVVTGVLFVDWMLRVRDNVSRLTSFEPRHSRGWVIGGWIVPILNLWRPKQIMNDLWRASDPSAPVSGVGSGQRTVSPLLNLWWGLWIVGGFGGWYLYQTRDVENLEGLRTHTAVDAVVDLVFAGAAIAALAVVTLLSQRQEERAARVFAEHQPSHVLGSRNLRAVVAGFAVAAVAVLTVGFVLFDATAAETSSGGAPQATTDTAAAESPTDTGADVTTTLPRGRGVLLADLSTGDCWNNQAFAEAPDTEYVSMLAVEVVPCTQPHLAEVYARQSHRGRSTDPYPGDAGTQFDAILLCSRPFENVFGHAYESSSLDILPLSPTEQSWRAGDRGIVCSAGSLDGAALTGPAKEVDTRLAGTEMDVLAAGSCADLADIMVISAQAIIAVVDSTPEEELAQLGPNEFLPGTERYFKRDVMIVAHGFDLGCTIGELNELFIPHADGLTASTLTGDVLVNMYRTGYFDENAFG